MEIIRPFGPVIAKIKIPSDLLEKLNNYTKDVISNNEKKKILVHSKQLAGNVTQEFIINGEFGFSSGWFEFLSKNIQEYIFLTTKKKITKCTIIHSWIVRQFSNEYNPVHNHSGHISGAGWLKLPEQWGEYYNQIKLGKDNPNGNLDLIYGSPMFLNHAIFRIKPEIGDFFLFPHYLMHCVWPFNSKNDHERRSISFNAKIDEEIFNIYI